MKFSFTFLVCLVLISSSISFSQRPGDGRPSAESIERVKAMKVAMITEKLALTEDQAKGFWPVYNKYDGEKRSLNQSLREQMRKNANGSEDAEIARQDAIFKLREQELEVARKYRPDFLKVISAAQYSKLLLAEREFNQMLLRELRERRENRP